MPDADECCKERDWWGFRRLRGSGKHSGIRRPWAEAAKNEPVVFVQQPGPGWLELSGWGEWSGRGWGRGAVGSGREEPLQDFIRIWIWEELEGPPMRETSRTYGPSRASMGGTGIAPRLLVSGTSRASRSQRPRGSHGDHLAGGIWLPTATNAGIRLPATLDQGQTLHLAAGLWPVSLTCVQRE